MFGVSFPELVVLGTVALLVLGPDKLPGMLRTMGQWVAKLRRLTTEVRYQSGIDEVLRAEGFDGGLNELRSIMRGGGGSAASHSATIRQPSQDQFVSDKSREYPAEGPDAYGALPEDLVSPAPAALPPGDAALAPAAQLPEGTTAPELPPAESGAIIAPPQRPPPGLPAPALASEPHPASSPEHETKP